MDICEKPRIPTISLHAAKRSGRLLVVLATALRKVMRCPQS